MRFVRTLVLLTAVTLPVLVSAGPAAAVPARVDTVVLRVDRFAPWSPAAPPSAVTYDENLVPARAIIVVSSLRVRGGTLVWLRTARLAPNHRYGTHVHRQACGADPATTGGRHYQNVPDPVQPSARPEYANPANEAWLDFTTDAHGFGAATTLVRWTFRPGEANAVVLHAEGTRTGPGEAGMAGRRVACLTLPL
jgi:superoxide dismutase, Cu-Zn family